MGDFVVGDRVVCVDDSDLEARAHRSDCLVSNGRTYTVAAAANEWGKIGIKETAGWDGAAHGWFASARFIPKESAVGLDGAVAVVRDDGSVLIMGGDNGAISISADRMEVIDTLRARGEGDE